MENGRLSREYAELLMNRFLARYRDTAKVYVGCNEAYCSNRFAIEAKHYTKHTSFGCAKCLEKTEEGTYNSWPRK